MKTFRIIVTGMIVLVCLLSSDMTFADVAIKIVIANPSDSEKDTVPVRYELPAGLEKTDVVDTAGLNVDYDIGKSLFFVYGEIELDPKEVKTLKVVIKDIWNMSVDEIDELLQTLDDRVDVLSKEEDVDMETLYVIAEDLRNRLEMLKKYQTDNAGSIENRMRLYSKNEKVLQKLRDRVFSLSDLKSIKQREGEEAEPGAPITIIIEAQNMLDSSADLPVQYYLPKEVLPEYIEDPAGFKVEYELAREQFYLNKRDSFGPREKKRYAVKIRNIWTISEKNLDAYVQEATDITADLMKTESAALAVMLLDSIKKNAETIVEEQNAARTVKEYIAVYRDNKKRLAQIEDDLEKLRNLNKMPIAEDAKEQKEGLRAVVQEMDVLENIKDFIEKFLAERKKKGDIWKILMIIVVFVISLTVFFYGLWTVQHAKDQKRELEEVSEEEGSTVPPGSKDDPTEADKEKEQETG